MKLTNLLHGIGFAKILALITVVYWDWRNSALGNYYKLTSPETPQKEAFTIPPHQLFKTNPYSCLRLIVIIQIFLHL